MPPINVPVQVEMLISDVIGPKSIVQFTGVADVLRIDRFSRGTWRTGFAVVSENFTRWNMTVNQILGRKPAPRFGNEQLKVSGL
jgi:hypothetical protein